MKLLKAQALPTFYIAGTASTDLTAIPMQIPDESLKITLDSMPASEKFIL